MVGKLGVERQNVNGEYFIGIFGVHIPWKLFQCKSIYKGICGGELKEWGES